MDRYEDFEEIKNNERYEEIISNSIDHGRHRATTSHYSVKQILQEYMVFHRTLTDLLIEHKAYTIDVGILLKYTLETAMLNSADSFSNSLQDMRHKLVGTLAHDMRNPISAALFALEMLSPDDGEERFNKVKKMAVGSLRKSLDLMEGLLDAISVKAGEGITLNFKELDLMRDIAWVIDEAKEIYDNEINLQTTNEEINGIFDGTAVRRVLENLVTNGIKYGSMDEAITVKIEDGKEVVAIHVHNYGNPIPEEKQGDIFKFLNSSRDGESRELKSWGMGLTLVKMVAEAHGGKVSLESNRQDGTTFTFTLNKYLNAPGKTTSELNFVQQGE
jgi:signal transduction histidine kinase